MDVKRLLFLDTERRQYQLHTLRSQVLAHDPREDYTLLSGEALCQYVLWKAPDVFGLEASSVIARGPLVFLSGNKTTVGYRSPLTGLPHYSFVGGRGFVELLNLGLDAIVFMRSAGFPAGDGRTVDTYIVISGRAPNLTVTWESAEHLPTGMRSAYYWLVERELGGKSDSGSVFTSGEGARYGYRTANLGVDALYHAGRGGAGHVFVGFTTALVLRGDALTLDAYMGARADVLRDLRNGEIRQRLDRYCERLSRRDGGTVTKLYATGSGDTPTLPVRNALRLGYVLADVGARKVLKASRVGQTGCQWCQVNCRHWHWVESEYTPGGRDMVLDDFEPTYAILAMLDLRAAGDSLQERMDLLEWVDRYIVIPIEQLGCDIIDIGVGIAALFEGLERALIPPEDVPPFLHSGPYFSNLDLVAQIVAALRAGTDFPALRAVGDGPQALVARYPDMQDFVFTSGPGTLGNPGHGNALWTFLMPFSRFFGHYSGQIYKVPGDLGPDLPPTEIQALFSRVIEEMLQREVFVCLCNALSACAFTFIIFSEDGEGIVLDRSDLLVRTLAAYGVDVRREDLEWFAEAFWAQSIAFKRAYGWRPPSASDFPARIFDMLSQVLRRPPDELRALMDQLIAEWKRQAGARLRKYGYDPVD